MRFAAANSFSAADYAAAGRAASNSLVSSFAAARRNAPDWTGLARTSMNARSQERQAAMKAEADVATAGMRAFGNVKGTQIKGAYEHAALKTKLKSASRKAGRLGALGGFKLPKKSNSKYYDKMKEKLAGYKQEVPESEQNLNEFVDPTNGQTQIPTLTTKDEVLARQAANAPNSVQQLPTNPSSPGPTPSTTQTPSQPAATQTPSQPAATPGLVNPDRQQAYNQVYNLAKANPNVKFPHVVAAQSMHETGFLSDTGVYKATNYTNPFGQTGDRGYGTIPRKGFKDGWTLYPDMKTAVNDHISLWHDTKNHAQNYNAHNTIREGIAAVAPAYSPDADPVNIRKGFTVDKYSKGMTNILQTYGGITF